LPVAAQLPGAMLTDAADVLSAASASLPSSVQTDAPPVRVRRFHRKVSPRGNPAPSPAADYTVRAPVPPGCPSGYFVCYPCSLLHALRSVDFRLRFGQPCGDIVTRWCGIKVERLTQCMNTAFNLADQTGHEISGGIN